MALSSTVLQTLLSQQSLRLVSNAHVLCYPTMSALLLGQSGTNDQGDTTYLFQADIDDVALWSRILTPREVDEIYSQGVNDNTSPIANNDFGHCVCGVGFYAPNATTCCTLLRPILISVVIDMCSAMSRKLCNV